MLLQALVVVHQRDHVARRDREHREEADQRTKRERGAVDQARQHAAHESQRQDRERHARQAPAPESRLQEQEDPDQGDDPEAEQAGDRGLVAGCGPDCLRVVLEREPVCP